MKDFQSGGNDIYRFYSLMNRTGEPESMSLPYGGFSAVQHALTSAMSELEKNEEKQVEDIQQKDSAAPVTQDSGSGSSDATVVAPGSEGAAAGGCTLVAKWQGSTIELPALPRTTTIGEVKARSYQTL